MRPLITKCHIGRETIRVETDLDYKINKLKKAGTERAGGARRYRLISDLDGNQVVFVQGNGEASGRCRKVFVRPFSS